MKESGNIEFKEKISNTFLKTVSAFANYGGGQILFGIADNGHKSGIENPAQTCLDIENKINDSIKPRPDFTLSVNCRSRVITLVVEEGLYRPYLYKGKAYRRSDTATVEVDQEELKQLILEGKNITFEELASEESELSFSILAGKMKTIMGIEKTDDDILKTLGLFTDKGKYNHAAALLADKNKCPGIEIVRFGESINEILDRENFAGQSILLQYDQAVLQYRKYYQYEVIRGIQRDIIERIPEKAFREAVANALIHRRWDLSANIQIGMYEDRIECTSPGGLPGGITKEEYLHGNISNLRNPVLGMLFYRLRFIEMFGTGIRRIRGMYAGQRVSPAFEVLDGSITISLPVLTEKLRLTTDEEKVFSVFSSGRKLGSGEVAEISGFQKDKTIRLLNRLIAQGYVKKEGIGRSTKYRI